MTWFICQLLPRYIKHDKYGAQREFSMDYCVIHTQIQWKWQKCPPGRVFMLHLIVEGEGTVLYVHIYLLSQMELLINSSWFLLRMHVIPNSKSVSVVPFTVTNHRELWNSVTAMSHSHLKTIPAALILSFVTVSYSVSTAVCCSVFWLFFKVCTNLAERLCLCAAQPITSAQKFS